MKQDVKEKILEATLDIIAKETISGTRMKAIAEEAGVVQSNLHYYFNTKNELLLALLDNIVNFFQNQRSDIDLDESDNPLKRFFDQKKSLIMDNKKIDFVQFDFWLQGIVHPEIKPKMKDFFKVWRDEITTALEKHNGADRKELNIKSSLIISMLMGASMQYLIDEESFDLDDYFAASEKLSQLFLGDDFK